MLDIKELRSQNSDLSDLATGTIDANVLEILAKERPDECFLRGTGILKLTGAIRTLERENRELKAKLASAQPINNDVRMPIEPDTKMLMIMHCMYWRDHVRIEEITDHWHESSESLWRKTYKAMVDYIKSINASQSAQPTNSDVWDAELEEAAEIFDAPVRAVLLNCDVCELIRALKSTREQGGDK